MLPKLKSKILRKRIVRILYDNPDNRDSDSKLQANIWFQEGLNIFGTNSLDGISAFEFLKAYAAGRFSSAESIRRQRQKVQEEFRELRGKKYFLRQQHSKKVRNRIHTV